MDSQGTCTFTENFLFNASACPVCYPSVEESVALMPNASSDSPVKKLEYIYEENIRRETEFGGSDFGGYLTLAQRTDSFDVRESMRVHCGLVFSVFILFLSCLLQQFSIAYCLHGVGCPYDDKYCPTYYFLSWIYVFWFMYACLGL